MQQQGRVQLLVYDLSRGMAVAMSQSILGQQIEGIWHTGIQVFDTEYFFGGGIQAQPRGLFAMQHQMQATRTLELGVTVKTKSDLQAYLMTIQSRFTAATYDLIRNNCNNFSDTISQFLTGQRIPSYIVDLPSIVFNTPGGQMLRPMIENMQNAVYSQQHAGINATSSYTLGASSVQQSYAPPAYTSPPIAYAPPPPVSYPPAVLEDKPLVSSDNKTVDTLGNKIIALKVLTKDDDGNVQSSPALSEEEKAVIKRIMQAVTSPGSPIVDSTSFSDVSCKTLTRVMEGYITSHMSCLFLMRLLILEESLIFKGTTHTPVVEMVDWVINRLASPIGFTSVPATVMALCTLANLLSHESGRALVFDREGVAGSVVDVAVAGLSHARAEVRQMSATVAYNLTLAFSSGSVPSVPASTPSQAPSGTPSRLILGGVEGGAEAGEGGEGELNPLGVQLFCGAMEGVSSEQNHPVRHRRLSVALLLIRIGGGAARTLGRDLGFHDDVTVITASTDGEKLVIEEMKKSLSSSS